MIGPPPVAGVTLISVMLLISVSALLQGRAAETWDSQVRHEQEEDLIFFGEQYKWAIEQFWAANGRAPVEMEDLCPKDSKANRRYIRRCYLDPITGDEFRKIAVGQQGKRKQDKNKKEKEKDGEETKHRDDLSERDGGPALSSSELSEGPGQASHIEFSGDVPFIGVASESGRAGFRTLDDAEFYDEWEFVATVRQAPTVQPGQGAPGGRPGGPGGRPGAPGGRPGVPGGRPGVPGAGSPGTPGGPGPVPGTGSRPPTGRR